MIWSRSAWARGAGGHSRCPRTLAGPPGGRPAGDREPVAAPADPAALTPVKPARRLPASPATVDRIENCQMGTFPACAGPGGHAVSDRESCVFARVVDRRLRPAPAGGDPGEHRIRDQAAAGDGDAGLGVRGEGALAVVTTAGTEAPADELIADLPARSWRRLPVGAGADGPREYDWA